MSTFFRISILKIPWGNPSFKDFAGVVFPHFDLWINWSQLAVHKNRAKVVDFLLVLNFRAYPVFMPQSL